MGLAIIILWIGILLMGLGWYRSRYRCPPPVVEYRFVPRTFKEEQESPVNIEDFYYDMFKSPSPWPFSSGYRVEDEILKSRRKNN